MGILIGDIARRARRAGGSLARGLLLAEEGEPHTVPLGPGRGLVVEVESEPSLDYYIGLFESEHFPWLRRLLAPGMRTIDVGGYNGWYALLIAHHTRAAVTCVEGRPERQAQIARNLGLNPDLAPLVHVVPSWVGASDEGGQTTLDALSLMEGQEPPGFIKVDVDGAETEVLRGARRLLAEHSPHLIVETHDPQLERECGDLLIAAGYRPRIITQRRLAPQSRPAEHNRWLVAAGR